MSLGWYLNYPSEMKLSEMQGQFLSHAFRMKITGLGMLLCHLGVFPEMLCEFRSVQHYPDSIPN